MDNASFAADIKKFEETLAKDPSSYCFAPLAELYRKSGMLDEAIATAGKGTSLHPQYVGGFMALGRAYLDKGMNSEAREALQTVVGFTPDNMLAHKLLCRIYRDAGENHLLKGSLEALISLNPADTESRALLESLGALPQSGDPMELGVVDLQPEELGGEGLEELDLLDELEEVGDAPPAVVVQEEPLSWLPDESADEEFDDDQPASAPGIDTATIAQLYAAQGHQEHALDIYRKLSMDDPGNEEFRERIAELEESLPVDEQSGELPFPGDQVPIEDVCPAQETLESDGPIELIRDTAADDPVMLDDQVVTMLQGWMENIRRVRECRSGRD